MSMLEQGVSTESIGTLDRLSTTWQQATEIWASGGWAMWAIAVIAVIMFATGVHVRLGLREKGFQSVPEDTWRRWIDRPHQRQGPIGELMDFVSGGEDLAATSARFEQLQSIETAGFERELRVMRICVSAAPLVGLLGTVSGMLATFGALATGSGGAQTMEMVAGGISEALVTTETGLVIALPGLFFQYQLVRGCERYKAFLAHLETVFTQKFYWRTRRERQVSARRVAAERVAEVLRLAVDLPADRRSVLEFESKVV